MMASQLAAQLVLSEVWAVNAAASRPAVRPYAIVFNEKNRSRKGDAIPVRRWFIV